MGDSSNASAGERFIAEFGGDYKRVSALDGDRKYVIEKHGLLYDDFHREVKYGITLRLHRGTASDPWDALEVIFDQPAAYDPQVGDPVDEICRVALDLNLPVAEVFQRFKRADLVPEDFTLADFPPELLKEVAG